jgi:hypothetical protein
MTAGQNGKAKIRNAEMGCSGIIFIMQMQQWLPINSEQWNCRWNHEKNHTIAS